VSCARSSHCTKRFIRAFPPRPCCDSNNTLRERVNPIGKAIVWYDADQEEEAEEADAVVRVIIYCFKPLDTY
jgi:hypothetical protein